MSSRQWKRVDVLRRLAIGELTVPEAARALGLSERQVQRLRQAVAAHGEAGVIHGNAGRAPPNRLDDVLRARIVKLARKRYEGFNDHHLTDKLVEVEHLTVSRASVQRLLRAAGIGPEHRRRPPKHRRRRERRAQAGLMVL